MSVLIMAHHSLFQIQHANILEVITPLLTRRNKMNELKINEFSWTIRAMRPQDKLLPKNLERHA